MDSIRNMKKNVIAYSLWGDHPMYWKGALRNIEQAKKYFPGWICRFYIDKDCDQDLVETIKGDNVEVIMVDSVDSFHGMFWRFWSAEDPNVEVFLSRDCDSRFSDREVYAIKEWLASDKDFHIMRDHPYHTTAVLGGMWGCRNGIMREIGLNDLIDKWSKFERKGIDQEFLGQKVYPLVKERSMEHSEFGLYYGGHTRNFPTKRVDYEFVGDVFDENDNRHPDYWVFIKRIEG
jgi:hypothetical protein